MTSSKRPRTQYSALSGVNAFLSSGNGSSSKKELESITPIETIQLPQTQPRRYFDPVKLDQLAESIREYGILEPLLVRRLSDSDEKYELVAGERRYRAAQQAGLTEVPIAIRELDDEQALQVALIENLQREDLNPVEETEGLLDLLSISLKIPKEDIISTLNIAAHAKRKGEILADNVIRKNFEEIEKIFILVGTLTPESFRTNRLPLLNLPREILEALSTGKIEYTKARAISKVKHSEQRRALLEKAISENLSLTQIKKCVASKPTPTPNPASAPTPAKAAISFNRRIQKIEQVIHNKGLLDNPETQKEIDKLLKTLEDLIGD